jgi:hypothetical protein
MIDLRNNIKERLKSLYRPALKLQVEYGKTTTKPSLWGIGLRSTLWVVLVPGLSLPLSLPEGLSVIQSSFVAYKNCFISWENFAVLARVFFPFIQVVLVRFSPAQVF